MRVIFFMFCASVFSNGGTQQSYNNVNRSQRNSFTPNIQTSSDETSTSSSYRVLSEQIPDQKFAIKQRQQSIWTSTTQTRRIIDNHNQGSRTLILMRGLPGSGKSFLAKTLAETMCPMMDYKTFVFSTDDFFVHNGKYEFDRSRLQEAHNWNQNRVRAEIDRGLSPIFVDNTNIEMWEMEPYVRDGVRNGYIIEVLEPKTPWARDAEQLFHKNSHNVTLNYIEEKLSHLFSTNITGDSLIKHFKLFYPTDKVLPVIRNFPPVSYCYNSKHPVLLV